MHSFVLKNKHADSLLGTHQKLDRLAYRSMRKFILDHNKPLHARAKLARFPTLKMIQHFEGINGPDGIKLKSPGQQEMAHFYDPHSEEKQPILELLAHHQGELKKAIIEGNEERAAFEASWLAHALVDGLTPAHHFPYEKYLAEIRGEGGHTRTSKTKKMLVRGESARDTLRKNWQVIGAKGLLTTHMNFEGGVASVLLPLRLRSAIPSAVEVAYASQRGLIETFQITAKSIADLELYERFYRQGWTVKLARDVKGLLLPQLVKMVTLAWLLSFEET